MEVSRGFLLLFFSVHLVCGTADRETPRFSDQYHTKGVTVHPFADLSEPFEEWYDGKSEQAKRLYYDGIVTYVTNKAEDEDYTMKHQFVYTDMKADGIPRLTCFKSWDRLASIVPDLDGFEFQEEGECPTSTSGESLNTTCEKWSKKVVVTPDEKEEHYDYYLIRGENDTAIPVYYKMLGHDPVMGTGYDRSDIFFKYYSIGEQSNNSFNYPSNVTCEEMLGEHSIRDYVDDIVQRRHDSINPHFERFKKKHDKQYADSREHELRKNIFRQNWRYVQAKNRQHLKYRLAINHLADKTPQEYKRLLGRLPRKTRPNGTIPFVYKRTKIPKTLDWRLSGAITPIKNQGDCGSCWSFGVTGATEGAYFVKYGIRPTLSEQQLVDCGWFVGVAGCDGGFADKAWDYAKIAGGMATTDQYGDYLMEDGKCHDKQTKKLVKIKGHTMVPEGDAKAMKAALVENGPIAIAIHAGERDFMLYANGVYTSEYCPSSSYSLNHEVLAVGYGKLEGDNYWLVKNSWGHFWGNDGYILISQENNLCGVLTEPCYPHIK